MVFSEPLFLFIFLPIALAVILASRGVFYYTAIFCSSIIFYYWGSGSITLVLLFSVFFNWAFAKVLHSGGRHRPASVLWLGISVNLLILIYYKYAFFLSDTVFGGTSPEGLDFLRDVLLPIGISFFTFQGMSYLVDVWRGDIEAEPNVMRFGAYLTFFPQLIAGPIVRYADVRAYFLVPQRSFDDFSAGGVRFFHGLLKKVLVADSAGAIADGAFATPHGELGLAAAWIGAIAYTVQIYFDFSGYSDMAIGIGRMCGVRFNENFARPYSASTITEFWRRWHISLSSWFRDYVYIPLGGNRVGPTRTYVNLGLVFLLTGAWHGAAWTFIVWGLYHGAFLILERATLGRGAANVRHQGLRLGYLLPVVLVGWVLFRAESLPDAGAYLASMTGLAGGSAAQFPVALMAAMTPAALSGLLAGLVIFALPRGDGFGKQLEDLAATRPAQVYAYGCLAAILALSLALASEFSPFLYFQF